MKHTILTCAICLLAVAVMGQSTALQEIAEKSKLGSHMESLLPQSNSGNLYHQYDFNWDAYSEAWDSNGVTNVFPVDAGGGKTDLHVYTMEFDFEGNRMPFDQTIIYNFTSELGPNGEILDAARTTVFADSIHSSQYNEETGEFELAFVGYLTSNGDGQLASLEYLINGNLNDPPLGFIPFLRVNYYYDNADRLAALAQYFVNYYTFQLQLEDSTVISYDQADLPIMEVDYFQSGNISTTRFAYDNDERPMYEVTNVMSNDTLLFQDSIFRTYSNMTDFQDDYYVYIVPEMAYDYFQYTTFAWTNQFTTVEATYWFDGGGEPYPTRSYTETFDEMDRLTNTLTQGTFAPGPLENEEMQVFVYPTSSGTSDVDLQGLDVLVKTHDGLGIEFEFPEIVTGTIESFSAHGVQVAAGHLEGSQHFVSLDGLPMGVYYFQIHTDIGTTRLGVIWKG